MSAERDLNRIRELERRIMESPTLDTLTQLESLYQRNAMSSQFSQAEASIQESFVDGVVNSEELINLSPYIILPLSRFQPRSAGHEAIIDGIFMTIWDRFETHRLALLELNVRELESATVDTADPYISAILRNYPPLPEKFAEFMAQCEDSELLDHILLRIKYRKRHVEKRKRWMDGNN